MIATDYDRMKAAPQGGGTPLRGLTRSSDLSREGLVMKATRMCRACGNLIERKPGQSTTTYKRRRYCDRKCYAQNPYRTVLPAERFWSNVDTSNSCWPWLLHIDRRGYGRVYWDGQQGRSAHRVAWELTHGEIPGEMTVDHICFNPRCVRPEHLQLLTMVENQSRTQASLATQCKNGHEYTPENTHHKIVDGRERRVCRACNRNAVRRYKARKADA